MAALSVTLLRSPSNAIEDTWRALEPRSNASFFVSACWIGAWLRTMQPNAICAVVSREDSPIAAAIFVQRPGALFGLRRARYWLHEIGDPTLDAIFIEYNSILSEASVTLDAWRAIRTALRAEAPRPWGAIAGPSIVISGASPEFADVVARGGSATVARREKSPFVNLSRLRQENRPYLEALSANTRQQLRRARRAFEGIGALLLKRAENQGEALEFLSELKPLHIARWRARGRPSGFDNPAFEPMLRQLITLGLEDGLVDVLRLSAGDRAFGYLVNFRYRGAIMNYTSGFAYGPDEKLKPGLVSHLLAIEQAQCEGADSYKFLAGLSRYKQSLSTDSEELVWLRDAL